MRGRVVVAVVVALVVLVGGAFVADGVARGSTEQRIAGDVQAQLPGLGTPPEVTIGGFPFLTQVLAGRLDDVRLTAPTLVVEGLRLEDVDVRLTGVSTAVPTTAEHAAMTATASLASIEDVLDAPVDLAIEDGHLVTSVKLLGLLELEAVLVPRPEGRSITVDIESVAVEGRTISVSDLPDVVTDQLNRLSIPVGLPEGMELTAVELTADGALLQAEGDDIVFDEVAVGPE